MPVIRHNNAAGGKLNYPLRRVEMQAVRHQINLCPLTQHAFATNLHALLLEVPMQRIGREIIPIQRLHPSDQFINRLCRIMNHRTARRINHVGLPSLDLPQASHQIRQSASVTMISAHLRLRNRILKTIQIKNLPIPINQISRKSASFSIHHRQI